MNLGRKMNSKEYKEWKKNVINNKSFIENNEVFINRDELQRIKKELFLLKMKDNRKKIYNAWNIIRDVLLIFILIAFISLISLYFLYPEEYKDIINNECSPQIEGDIIDNNSSCVCNNECNIPNEITLKLGGNIKINST